MNNSVKKLSLSALFLALGLVLPFLTGQIPQIGSMLLPMHIPVLICGIVCGYKYGGIVGLVLPLMRMMIFGMPPFTVALAMTFELLVYGLVIGLCYEKLPKKNINVYASLIIAMILGRMAWGIATIIILGVAGTAFTWPMFIAGAVTGAIPGIILQIVIIPPIVILLKKIGAMPNDKVTKPATSTC